MSKHIPNAVELTEKNAFNHLTGNTSPVNLGDSNSSTVVFRNTPFLLGPQLITYLIRWRNHGRIFCYSNTRLYVHCKILHFKTIYTFGLHSLSPLSSGNNLANSTPLDPKFE